MSLNGGEVAAKISGKAAERLAVLLYAVLKDQKKTRGKTRLTNMLKSGKELSVFAVKDSELQKFCEEAKKYGVLYCVLKDRDANDGLTDIMVKAEDAGKINRIFERFNLALLFERLESRNPEHIALKYYRSYHSGSGKTLKSIQITLISRLEKFNLESLASITQTDELELSELGERKMAIFAVIPDNDSSFNFIVGMLYTQMFQQLYYQADVVHGGRLPVHVHFVMDEFENETQL